MAKKSKFIKNLLTTASAAAMLVGGVNSALGAERTTTGTPVPLSVGGNTNLNGVFANGDTIKLGGAHDLSTAGPITLGGPAVDIDGNAGRTFTINDNVTMGAGALAMNVVQTAGTLTFGDDVTENVTVNGGTFNAQDLTGAGNGDGDLTVSGGTATVRDVAHDLTVSGGTATVRHVKNDLTVSGGTATVTANGVTNNVAHTGGTINITGNVGGTYLLNGADAVGTITGEAGGVVTAKQGTLTITSDSVAINFSTNDGATVQVNGDVGGNVDFGGKSSTFKLGNNANLNNEIIDGGAGVGTVIALDNTTLNAKIGDAGTILDFQINAGTVDFQSTIYKSKTFTFVGDGKMQFSNGVQTLTGNIVATGGGSTGRGTLEFNSGHNREVVGNVGTAVDPVKKLNFAGNDNEFKSTGTGTHIVQVTHTNGDGNAQAKGKLHVRGADAAGKTHALRIESENNKWLSELHVLKTAAGNVETVVEFTGKVFSKEVSLTAGKDHVFDMKSKTVNGVVTGSELTTLDFKFNEADQQLILGEKAKITGSITSNGAAGKGKIFVKGDATIKGNNVGVNAAELNTIVFDTAEKTLTREADAAQTKTALANGVDFRADGTLKFTGNQDHKLEGKVIIANVVAGGVGTIEFDSNIANKALEIAGNIGEATTENKMLKVLKNNSTADAGGNPSVLKLSGDDVHIGTYIFGGNSRLDLDKGAGGATYRFDHFEANGQGILRANQDLTLRTKTYGSETNEFNLTKLNKIQINGDKTVTIADASLLRANSLETNAAGEGVLHFAGDAVFDAGVSTTLIGGAAASKIKTIQVAGNAKTVDYRSDITMSQDIEFTGNGGIFKFSGEKLTADAGRTMKNDGAGTAGHVNFARTDGAQEINTNVSAGVKVEFSGRDVTLGDGRTSSSGEYVFSAADAMTADLKKSDIGAATFTVGANVNAVHTVAFDDLAAAGTLDFSSNNLGSGKAIIFKAKTGQSFKVSTTSNSQSAQFETGAKDKGILTFDAAGNGTVTISSIGTADNPFELVSFTSNGTVTNSVWTNKMQISQDRTATLNGAVGVGSNGDNDIEFQGENAAIVFGHDGLVLKHALKNTAAAGVVAGKATFGDKNSTIEGQIGETNKSIQEVNFNFAQGSTKVAKLKNDIHSDIIKVTNGGIQIDNTNSGVKADGALTVSAGTVDLGSSKFTSTGGNAVFDGAVTMNTSFNGGAAGGCFINEDGNLTFNANSSLAVNINDQTQGIPREDVTFTLLANKGTDVDDATKAILNAIGKVGKLSGSNELANWTLEVQANGNLVLKRTNDAKSTFVAKATSLSVRGDKATTNRALGVIADSIAGTPAGRFADDLGVLVTKDPAKYKEAAERMFNNTENAANQHTETEGALVSSRLATVSMPDIVGGDREIQTGFDDASASGVSAGDDHERHGVWATPFFANSTQKTRKNAPGYKGDSYGLTAGFDTKVNDDMIIGAAATYASSDIKHKDAKRGDKTKLDSYMFSVYGSQQLTTNWFLMGSATVGSNQMKNNSIRVTSTGNQMAKGKYSSMSFAGELLAGYNYVMNEFAVTPMAGFRYSRVNDGGYKETGTTNQNLDISKKASDKFDVIAGLRLSGSVYDMQGISVTPEAHAFVHHDLINKNARVVTKLEGARENLPQTSAKPIRTSYNLGLGANARYGMMEYGATYDAHLGNKFVSHQGTLKLRVNF